MTPTLAYTYLVVGPEGSTEGSTAILVGPVVHSRLGVVFTVRGGFGLSENSLPNSVLALKPSLSCLENSHSIAIRHLWDLLLGFGHALSMVSSVAVAWLVGGFSPRMLFLLEVNWGHHPICWMETFKTVKEKNVFNHWKFLEMCRNSLPPIHFQPYFPIQNGYGDPNRSIKGLTNSVVSSIQPTISLGRQVILNMVSSHCFFDLVIITAW